MGGSGGYRLVLRLPHRVAAERGTNGSIDSSHVGIRGGISSAANGAPGRTWICRRNVVAFAHPKAGFGEIAQGAPIIRFPARCLLEFERPGLESDQAKSGSFVAHSPAIYLWRCLYRPAFRFEIWAYG